MNHFQRILQGLCLALYLLFIYKPAGLATRITHPEYILALDPLSLLGGLSAGNLLIPGLTILILLLVLTALLGRFFCGHVCPLGSTLDLARPGVAPSKKTIQNIPRDWRRSIFSITPGKQWKSSCPYRTRFLSEGTMEIFSQGTRTLNIS